MSEAMNTQEGFNYIMEESPRIDEDLLYLAPTPYSTKQSKNKGFDRSNEIVVENYDFDKIDSPEVFE